MVHDTVGVVYFADDDNTCTFQVFQEVSQPVECNISFFILMSVCSFSYNNIYNLLVFRHDSKDLW